MVNKMKNKLIIFLLFMGTVSPTFAVGVPSGTPILSLGTSINIEYQNNAAVQMPPTAGTLVLDKTIVVESIYGFSLTSRNPANANIVRGQTYPYLFTFINRSNTSIDVTTNHSTSFLGNYIAPWNTTLNITAPSFNIDEAFTVTFSIQADADAADLAQGISMVSLNITNGGAFGAYTGFNDNLYGGIGIYSKTVTTTIFNSAVSYIAKTLTVISAPVGYGYRGGDSSYGHDPVPGSIIEYTIQIRNNGLGDSGLVEIEELIPTNAIFLNIPGNSDVLEVSSTLGAANDVDYDTDGTFNVGAPTNSYAGRGDVNRIKFRLSTLPAGISKFLRYRVTVRN